MKKFTEMKNEIVANMSEIAKGAAVRVEGTYYFSQGNGTVNICEGLNDDCSQKQVATAYIQDNKIVIESAFSSARQEFELAAVVETAVATETIETVETVETVVSAKISVDNGNSFVTAAEAIEAVGFDVIRGFMNDWKVGMLVVNETPDTDVELLELYLKFEEEDLIIG